MVAAVLSLTLFSISEPSKGAALSLSTKGVSSAPIDTLVLGVGSSETSHNLSFDRSDVVEGGLKEPARRLLPLTPSDYIGGELKFRMQVDPVKQSYFTVKFWGSDAGENRGRLILFCEGKQVGYRHLGDVDLLAIPNDDPPYNGRFYYVTTPLPLSMTHGKKAVDLQVRSIGRIWGYGTTWDKYQKKLEEPTVAMYRFYTHTSGYFEPPADEVQGDVPGVLPVRSVPGKELLVDLKLRVSKAIQADLSSGKPLTQDHIKFLAMGYDVAWTPAYHSDLALKRVVDSVDALLSHPTSGFASTNDDWVGWGSAAFAVARLAPHLHKVLDAPLDTKDGKPLTRREAWSGLFQYSRDSRRTHRRMYTNQSMILDLNVYLANRAIELIDPANALPEEQCLHYLYQAVGLEPWLGSDTPKGPDKAMGDHYYTTTAKGLTKELGYVGNYGEVLDWATTIFEATEIGRETGDARIRAQVEKLAVARSYFRYPTMDDNGNRAMRMEGVVGWRDGGHYPGEVVYAERDGWDGSPSLEATRIDDPLAMSYVQQMFGDGQYFATLGRRLKDNNFRSTMGMLDVPWQYDALMAHPAEGKKLPMTWTSPDIAWADEEDGVVAVKHGEEILYVSVYWRARFGINHLARLHYLTPSFDRIATVHEDEIFHSSGESATREDWVDLGFSKGLVPPGDIHQAQAGEKLPIAIPYDGYPVKVGKEDPYYGRAEFYLCRYGHYLIAMNASQTKTFPLTVPANVLSAPDLISGKTLSFAKTFGVAPATTVVLYLDGTE
jgi:hypothetical protein